MKVTVCELGNTAEELERDWQGLVRLVRENSSELVLLPEEPFYPWPFVKREFDQKVWDQSLSAHDSWTQRLRELAPAAVIGTRPVTKGRSRLNQGFAWTKGGYKAVHEKYYLPDEEGFWEASWYSRGSGDFEPISVGEAKIGLMICSELWSMPHAMQYGKSGAHIIATPRATEKRTVEKWVTGGRSLAIVSGCFSLSSNRISRTDESGNLGGTGWIIDPDGNVLGTTSRDRPFLSLDINLDDAVLAKKTYPRSSIFA